MSDNHPEIRVKVVDDHPLMRDAIRCAVTASGDINVVAEAGSGSEAYAALAESAADVALVDYRLPDTDGITLIHGLRERDPGLRFLMVTCVTDRSCVRAAVNSGVCGFLTKGVVDGDSLRDAVRKAYDNVRTMTPDALTVLLPGLDERRRAEETMTPRELEVWRMASEGKNNDEIAGQLFLSLRTVKFHIGNILRKTGARSRAEATSMAYRSGVMDDLG